MQPAARFDALVDVLVAVEFEGAAHLRGVQRYLFPIEEAVILRAHHRVIRDEAQAAKRDSLAAQDDANREFCDQSTPNS